MDWLQYNTSCYLVVTLRNEEAKEYEYESLENKLSDIISKKFSWMKQWFKYDLF